MNTVELTWAVFLEVLNSYHKETLIDNLEPFLKEIKKKLHSETAYVNIKFLTL